MLGLLTLAGLLLGSVALAGPVNAEDGAEGSAEESVEQSSSVEVAVRDDRFVSARLTVPAGTTVTWTHRGNNSHTVSAVDGTFESGTLERDDSFSFTFDTPGTYQYLCRQHLLQGMRGTITVE
jgi:plastocyanin